MAQQKTTYLYVFLAMCVHPVKAGRALWGVLRKAF